MSIFIFITNDKNPLAHGPVVYIRDLPSVVVNDILLLCSANCSLECKATAFIGALSFSQLSSQASDLLLRTPNDYVADDYVRAVELFHRLNADVTVINSSLILLEKTYLLLTQVNYFTYVCASFQKGYTSFNEDFVYVDMKSIRVYANNLLTEYSNTSRNNRYKIARSISNLVEQLQELDNSLRLAPDIYSSFNEAQWFYKSFNYAVNQCIVNIQNTVTYLSATLNDEDSFATFLSRNSLYANASAKMLCQSLYSNISQDLKIIQPILSFIGEKLSQWLYENSYRIVNSTSDVLANGLNTSNINSEKIPGIWYVVTCKNGCNLVISTLHHMGWKALVKNLAETQTTTIINDCLFQYETSLNQLYESTNKIINTKPQWNLGDALFDFLDRLINETTKLNDVLQSYLLGSVSLQMSMNDAVASVKAMSALIDNLKSQFLTSKHKWEDEVATWSNTIVYIYTATFASVQSFMNFLPEQINLTATISTMNIWQQPVIDIGDNFVLETPDVSDDIAQQINKGEWQNITEILLDTMKKAVLPNFDHASAFTDQFNVLYNQLADIQLNILVNVSQYSKDFVIDEQFVR